MIVPARCCLPPHRRGYSRRNRTVRQDRNPHSGRIMPRRARVILENGFYLVSARAGPGLLLFRDADDFEAFSALAGALLDESRIGLLAWCLLPDSCCMLLRAGGDDLKRFMRLLLGRYSRIRTDVRGSGVGLYGGERYSSRAFTDASALPGVIRFIHSLPARDGPVLFAEAWKWTSLRQTKPRGRAGLSISPALAGLTSGFDPVPDPDEPEPDWSGFEIRQSPGPAPPAERFVPADPAAILAREYRVHRSRLVNPRGREQQALRHEAFRECRARWGMNYSEVARAFGVTPAAVINAVGGPERSMRRKPPADDGSGRQAGRDRKPAAT